MVYCKYFVDNISFEVKKGEIFAFLGPNGAGKSTTILKRTRTLLENLFGVGSYLFKEYKFERKP